MYTAAGNASFKLLNNSRNAFVLLDSVVIASQICVMSYQNSIFDRKDLSPSSLLNFDE